LLVVRQGENNTLRTKIVVLLVAVVVVITGAVFFVNRGDSPSTDNEQGSKQTKSAPAIELNVPAGSLLVAEEHMSLEVGVQTDQYGDIARVEYLLDGTFVAYSTSSPFTVNIDLSGLSAGDHTLQAIAYAIGGGTSRSTIFRFTITPGQPVVAADEASQNIVRNSVSSVTLARQAASSDSSSGSSGGGDSAGDNGGDNGGGDDPGDTTPWPDDPPAEICGNTALLSGPTSAPAGAVVVPAGDNSAVNFEQVGKTYWFATGTHTIGNAALSQIEPKDNSTYIGAPGAIIDGQGVNRHLFSQHGANVKIQYLTIQNFVTNQNEGTVNHDSGVGWLIEYNTIQNNGGAGVFGGSDNIIRYNCLKDNGQYGFQVFSNDDPGPDHVVIDHNEIVGNNQDDWESQIVGCGCTGGGKFWDADNVDITNNYVHDNLSVGLWADTNDNDFLIENNYIEGNHGQGLFYEISYNMIVRNNNFIGNAVATGAGNPSFPTGAIYLSEAGGDSRVAARTAQVEIYDNRFLDNWSGVILWENADRYCGSPNNTSTGTCTLVNPAVDLTTCKDPALGGTIDQEPAYSDCRWKTQNVHVHDNVFSMDRDSIPQCTTDKACGFQGIFSNVGSDPDWSPYLGSVIQQAITFDQNNVFSDNTYIGDWYFRAKAQDRTYNFSIWQNDPFDQDVGSTFNGEDHLVVANALDEDTATIEGSLGDWVSWFSANISRTTAEAHSGTHSMKVDITAPFGWGVQFADAAGFPVTPTPKKVSFWGKLGAGTLSARVDIRWLDENQSTLRTDSTLLSPLTTSWQQSSVDLTPPAGTATVKLSIVHSSGTSGNSLYIDDIVVADN
jgi:hypothetical protein